MTDTADVPLFPLSNLVLPGGLLPLRIFETRYLDMVRDVMRRGTGFVIVLSTSGRDTGTTARPRDVGTYVEIIDFDALEHGFLGIVCRGMHRVRIHDAHATRTGLWLGQTTAIANEADADLPDACEYLADLAMQLVTELGTPFDLDAPQPRSASWVSARLTEMLPMHPDVKQQLLETNRPLERLDQVACFVNQMIRTPQR